MRILHPIAIFLLFLSNILFLSCSSNVKSELKVGVWKAELYNQQNIPIPFTFEVSFSNGKRVITIHNAEEKLRVDDILEIGDSTKISMPFFDSEFMVAVYEDSLIGRWTKIYADHVVSMPIKALYNNQNRFEIVKHNQNKDFEGTWNTIFMNDDYTDTSGAIGEFKIVGNKLYGTFLSTTGDYRYLEGVTDSDKLYLSTFDGSHAYLFTAEISKDGSKIEKGVMYSGWAGKQIWNAIKDPNAKLPNADSLTFLKDGFDEIDFNFKNIDKKNISLKDEKYKGKVILIQIMGSWCPNCMDETSYLVPFYNSMKQEGLEIIGLCYERSADFSVASANVIKMKNRLNIPYELLLPGPNKKGFVNESLPMLKNFLAFPTMIIIDKKGKVRKIHTGYSGPATGQHYVEFKSEFEAFVKQLLSEK